MAVKQSVLNSFGLAMRQATRLFLGLALLLLGALVVLTIWFLPLGVVIALLGLAVILSGLGLRRPDTLADSAPKKRSASVNALRRILTYLSRYEAKTGASLNPQSEVRNHVRTALARNLDHFGRPLCPCVHNPDDEGDLGDGECWLCPCEEMRCYKYCHCQLFVAPSGLPITEYLPEDHPGRMIYGLVEDPAPGHRREEPRSSPLQTAT